MKAISGYSIISNDLFGVDEHRQRLASTNKNNLAAFIPDRLYKRTLGFVAKRHLGPSQRRLGHSGGPVGRMKMSASNDAIRSFLCSPGDADEKNSDGDGDGDGGDEVTDTSSTTSSPLRTSSTSLLSSANIGRLDDCADKRDHRPAGRIRHKSALRSYFTCTGQQPVEVCQSHLYAAELRHRAKRIWNVLERCAVWKSRLAHSKSMGSLQVRQECPGALNQTEQLCRENPSTNGAPMRRFIDTFHYGTSHELWLQARNNQTTVESQSYQHQKRSVPQSYSLDSMPCRPQEPASAFKDCAEPPTFEFRRNVPSAASCRECSRRVMMANAQSDLNQLPETLCTEGSQLGSRKEVICGPSLTEPEMSHLAGWLHCSGLTVGIPETRDVILARPHEKQPFGMRIESDRSGVYLTTVIPESPAALAGLKVGDEVLRLNGYPVAQLCNRAITELIRSTPHYLRISYRSRIIMCVSRNTEMTKVDGRFGMRLKQRSEGLFIDVVLPESPADLAGIRSDDQVLYINGQNADTWSQDETCEYLRNIPTSTTLRLCIRRQVAMYPTYYNPEAVQRFRMQNHDDSPRHKLQSKPCQFCFDKTSVPRSLTN